MSTDGIKIFYTDEDVKNKLIGEDICFGAHTPMGIILDIESFDVETMSARVIVEYPDGEIRYGTIEIDDDLGGFDAKEAYALGL